MRFANLFSLLFPAFKHREILPHHVFVFLFCHRLWHVFVHLIDKLCTELYHLVHCAVVGKLAILITIHAVIFVFAAVGICAQNLLIQRHSAALTEFNFLFHIKTVYHKSSAKKEKNQYFLSVRHGKIIAVSSLSSFPFHARM